MILTALNANGKDFKNDTFGYSMYLGVPGEKVPEKFLDSVYSNLKTALLSIPYGNRVKYVDCSFDYVQIANVSGLNIEVFDKPIVIASFEFSKKDLNIDEKEVLS